MTKQQKALKFEVMTLCPLLSDLPLKPDWDLDVMLKADIQPTRNSS